MPQQTACAFFSYSREDSEFVLKLASSLKDHGAAAWLDQLDIKPGQHWDSAVESALADCPNMLLILSPSSVASQNVMDEVSYAIDEQKLIIPVLYRTCKIPFRLRRVQYVDARTEYDKALEELLHLLSPTENAEAERAERKKEQQKQVVVAENNPPEAVPAAPKVLPRETIAVQPTPAPQSRTAYWIAASVAAVLLLITFWYIAANRTADAAKGRGSEISGPTGTPANPGKSEIAPIQAPAAQPTPIKFQTAEWVQGFLSAMQGPQADNLRPYFDQTVSPYYNLPIANWEVIKKDKENFFKGFPSIQYTLSGEPTVDRPSDDRVALALDISYAAVKQSGQHSQGRSHLSIDLRLVDGEWKIAGIREKVF
jgi:hypothetical protein